MFLSYAFAYLLGFFEGSSQIPVAASLIDAHAGALGMLATKYTSGIREDISNMLGIIAGTSACHMILNTKPIKINGVWGPYDSAIIDDMWLHEGGQSAVGSLLDHVVETHSAYVEANKEAKINNISIQEYLFHIVNFIFLSSLILSYVGQAIMGKIASLQLNVLEYHPSYIKSCKSYSWNNIIGYRI